MKSSFGTTSRRSLLKSTSTLAATAAAMQLPQIVRAKQDQTLTMWVPGEPDSGQEMMPEYSQADAVEGGFGRCQLLEHLNTRTRFLKHPTDAADLSFNPVQPADERLLLRNVERGRSVVGRILSGSRRRREVN